MPLHDWQFWIVTLLAIGGAWMLIRAIAPRRSKSIDDPACPNCAAGSAAASSKTKRRVPLTIEKKRV
jgi:hypothetical protein